MSLSYLGYHRGRYHNNILYLPTKDITAGSAAESTATRKLVKYEDLSKIHVCTEAH